MNLPGKDDTPTPPSASSRVVHFQPDFRWEGIPVTEYKHRAEHFHSVARMTLIGGQGENTAFHVRYFEVAPGGFTSLEEHVHEHAVLVLRGQGQVQLGDEVHEINFGDLVYVAPRQSHQFRNPTSTEPLGFLCIVDAVRDRPVSVAKKQQDSQ